jgi:polar amino acid transport system permease protein
MTNRELIVDLLRGGISTLEIAAGAWVISAILGLVLALVRDASARPVRVLIATLIAVLRSVPQLVLLYLVFFGLPSLGIDVSARLTAILVLGIADSSFNAEYYRASLMTVPQSQRDAGTSLGFSSLGTLAHVVLPQSMLYMIAPLLNSFLSLLKTATLASAIGIAEILYRAQNDIQLTGRVIGVIAIVIAIYVAACFPLVRLIATFEQRAKRRLYE